MIKLPLQPNNWVQKNTSDVLGDIYASYNLDTFSNRGRLRVSDRMMLNTSDISPFGQASQITNMGCPIAFRSVGSSIYAIAGSKLVQASSYPSNFFALTTAISGSLPTNLATIYSDLEYFNGFLYMTGNDKVITKMDAANNFTTITNSGFGTTETKMLCSFQNRMYMTFLNSKIASWDTSDTIAVSGAYTVDLGDSSINKITFIRASSNRIWIGTVNTLGGKGYVYEWDGTATQTQKSYRLEAQGALACVIKDDIPYVIDTYGNLLAWNGSTFKKLAGLNRINNQLLNGIVFAANSNFIHPNGMSLVNGKIHALLDTRNFNSTANNEETLPAGIYGYDEDSQSLIHRYSLSYLDRASSRPDNEDFGQIRISQAGALSEMNLPSTNSARNGTFLAGATIFSDVSATVNAIFNDDSTRTKQKAGYIITPKFDAIDVNNLPSVQNMYQNVYTLYRSLIGSTDKIVIKYRKIEIEPVEISITWASTTSFTTSTDLSALVGYEIEVLQGIGAGRTSHIVTAVFSAGTSTVTVDETYTNASNQTAKARVQNWKKISSITTSSSATYDQAGISELSNWIQLKVWMLFTGKDEIEKLIVINQNYNPAN